MTDPAKSKNRFIKALPKFLGRLLVVLVILAGVGILSLKLLETAGAPLKEGIEAYLSQATGLQATVGEMKETRFFPDVALNLRDLSMRPGGENRKQGVVVEEISLSVPFLNLLIGHAGLERFSMRGFRAPAGVMTQDTLLLRSLSIREGFPPQAVGEGTYGGKALRVTLDLVAQNGLWSRNTYYRIPKRGAFTLTLDSFEINGVLTGEEGRLVLSDAVFSEKKRVYGKGSFNLFDEKGWVSGNPLDCLFRRQQSSGLTSAAPCARYFEVQ